MAPEGQKQTTLCVFDFDDTVVDCNSDTWIYTLAPKQKIPDTLQEGFDGVNWTGYMRKVFNYLHECGVTREDYEKCLQQMPFVPGMEELLTTLANAKDIDGSPKYELAICSDANSFFISTFLEHHKLDTSFTKIFTNPGTFDANGKLGIEEYHIQDWCKISAINMCKGHILDDYIKQRSEEGVKYKRICYSGDGQNDLCPSLRLGANDVTCPRLGFSFDEILKTNDDGIRSDVKADVCVWSSGIDIAKFLGEPSITEQLKSTKICEPASPDALADIRSLPTPPPSPNEDTDESSR